ncbi:DUF1553 domain-containing protein [uncultured Rubinisphaera sp.]|uniref:DUF1553 domain-containing protein n=1 Tax=uncultured Rubinisphaera sp. TaxID=1678686 RepID=UPI0030DD728F
MVFRDLLYSICAMAFLFSAQQTNTQAADNVVAFPAQILNSEPVFYWQMDSAKNGKVPSTGSSTGFSASTVGGATIEAGPRQPSYPDFSTSNLAVRFESGKQYLKVKDQKGDSPLKFKNGDELTIEAWVRPDNNIPKSYAYIVGKGRLNNPAFHANNQNYSFRLDSRNGSANLSFLFFDQGMLKGGTVADAGHRWTSKAAVPLDSEWHHVAMSYRFGDPKSIQGYIDGKPTAGTWDLAGETTEPPMVDDDDVWIGASMGGSNGFKGSLDEIAIYRRIVDPEVFAERYHHKAVDYLQQLVEETVKNAPEDRVVVAIHERAGESRSWKVRPTESPEIWNRDAFAITRIPRKYNERGIITDRQGPLLVHLYSKVTLPSGPQEIILRSLNSARLYVDGKLLQETPFMGLNSSAHGTMHKLIEPEHGELSCPPAHTERRFTFESDGKPHVFSMMTIAGHGSLPLTVGELTLAVGQPEQGYSLLGPERKWNFTDPDWIAFVQEERRQWEATNRQSRDESSAAEREYWAQRHANDRAWLNTQEQPVIPEVTGNEIVHPIDRFIVSALQEAGHEPTPPIDDWTFLRRISLDLTGTNPTVEQIAQFFADPTEHRREYAIERFLNDKNWADHWVGYWQDVLAENPALTKPNLNNSGPFRWYLHDAFTDNRSFDRMVTELVLMEGSRWGGGTAGFGVASNNDVPMAAKAHVLGTAFLGVEMKCARCHDAPYHESLQRDLFSMAAMLQGKPLSVPKSSSINVTPEELEKMTVKVTLKPGEQIAPAWPFEELIKPQSLDQELYLRDPANSRAVLAGMLTHPENERFTKVIVNRLWKRLMGYGIVEPAEDWETGEASHPELLTWLAQEFVRSGYDIKELTKIIVSSKLYQREALSGEYQIQQAFAGPTRKKLTAEQLIDTIFQSVGKELPSERLTYNYDGRQAVANFIDFGKPRKAWELMAISNERERPSMALPLAQSLVDVMSAYNWRSERQDPITDRESTATALQPLALANGSAINRAVDISENGELVQVCLQASSPEEIVNNLFQRILTRKPTAEEKTQLCSLLEPGFESRKTDVTVAPKPEVVRSPLTWTAHFDPDASREGIRQQQMANQGDKPTERLDPKWRVKVEDIVWALLNSPEFVFVP